MIVFNADMKPRALIENKGKPMVFTCDICGECADGVVVNPGSGREEWAVLPGEWAEVEDRRDKPKKQFRVICENGDCIHEAQKHAE